MQKFVYSISISQIIIFLLCFKHVFYMKFNCHIKLYAQSRTESTDFILSEFFFYSLV